MKENILSHENLFEVKRIEQTKINFIQDKLSFRHETKICKAFNQNYIVKIFFNSISPRFYMMFYKFIEKDFNFEILKQFESCSLILIYP